METKDYTVKNIDPEVLELVRDGASRMSGEIGVPVSFQAFVRKLLSDAASREYAAQQADSNNTRG